VALTQFIENDYKYIMVNIICRFFEGIGDSWVQTACYSLITLKFPENREKFIGISEAASGIGLMAGPGIAGILYTFLGFFYAFIMFAIMVLISAILCYVYVPNSINNSPAQYDEQYIV
jgi:MFS family permease